MIPPANAIQDDSGGNEEDQDETPKSPTTSNSQKETKVGHDLLFPHLKK